MTPTDREVAARTAGTEARFILRAAGDLFAELAAHALDAAKRQFRAGTLTPDAALLVLAQLVAWDEAEDTLMGRVQKGDHIAVKAHATIPAHGTGPQRSD